MDNFDDAYNELRKLQKHIGSKSVTIDFEKLDGVTSQELRSAIMNIIDRRRRDIGSNIQNNTNSNWL